MRGGTLFSGIGAPECAAPGIDWRWAAEIDPFADAVYRARLPGAPNLGDVRAVNWAEVEPVDVVVFGSPCQSFSVAGRRRGLDDPRGDLARVAIEAVGRNGARWFVFENVPGLLSARRGRDFAELLGRMAQCGYGVAWRIFDARHFGVPQRRRRLFVVGCLGDWRPAAAVLFECESLRRHPAARGETAQNPAGTAADGARSGSGGAPGSDARLIAFGGGVTRGPISVATTLSAHGGGLGRLDFDSETFIVHTLRGEGFDGSEDGTGRGTPLVPVMAFSAKNDGGDAGTGHAPTLRAMPHDGSHANGGGQLAAVVSGGVRRLTPRECERLMGFPDDWTAIPWRGRIAPDGRRYRALGNSMAVPVIGRLLDRLMKVDALPGLCAPAAESAWPPGQSGKISPSSATQIRSS
jgi:DNA (cytosine-5)-methyltransferase 1